MENQEKKNENYFFVLQKETWRRNINIWSIFRLQILEKAPENATYMSPMIQKDVLHILATKVRNKIREEVGDARFCVLVDEANDASNKEQIAIVLRFVDIYGNLQERFFEIVHVKDTSALTLKRKYQKFSLGTICTSEIYEDRDMMVPAICAVPGMG
ncbi:zinc finger MYM-type protein 1-like [Iris pallida]|uniref:Zinc finger MYM-type protein 1-like n=1 Tax=Iris pallida TaxID=29817 RepID=A0AAX6G955_IRIPA|nr:zinc finger MYM-type protein 1-like [Iris pallida]